MNNPYKYVSCHWCNNDLVLTNLGSLYQLLCPEHHIEILLNNKKKHIRSYTIFYDDFPRELMIIGAQRRYRIISNEQINFTQLSSRRGAEGYKQLVDVPFIPLQINNGIIQATPLFDRLKKLLVFS